MANRVMLVSALLTLYVVAAAAAVAPPPPPYQTAAQAARYAQVARSAKIHSAAAKPTLIAYLARPSFVAELEICCPRLAVLSPTELLAKLSASIRSTEITHNVERIIGAPPGISIDEGSDFEASMYLQANLSILFFPNEWQVRALWQKDGLCTLSNDSSVYDDFEDYAETRVYGAKHFPIPKKAHIGGRFCNLSFASATERPIYAAFNIFKVDAGNPIFGTLSFVFNRSYVAAQTIISPVDTGLLEMVCNKSLPLGGHHTHTGHCGAFNTSGSNGMSGVAWFSNSSESDTSHPSPVHLGTLDDWHHLVIPSDIFWSGNSSVTPHANAVTEPPQSMMAQMFSRIDVGSNPRDAPLQPLRSISSNALNAYWESNVIGTIDFPAGVSFLVADFQIFGTEIGAQAKTMALRMERLLVWARGGYVRSHSKHPSANTSLVTYAMNGR